MYQLIAQLAQVVTADPIAVVWFGVPAMFLIVGAVQVFKQAGLPTRFAGILALGIGIAGGILVASTGEVQYPAAIASGAMTGLAASGAWSVGTAAVRAGN